MSRDHINRLALGEAVLDICQLAANAIVAIYHSTEPLGVNQKADDSPITLADRAAHEIIVEGLKQLTPELPILSEEGVRPAFDQRCGWARYWLVDPLDGTREFIDRTGEFTINVALIEHGVAVVGVIVVPLQAEAYIGITATAEEPAIALKMANGSRKVIQASTIQSSSLVRVLTSSRSHGEELLACIDRLQGQFGQLEWVQAGSALKFCYLAEGRADIYPRFSACCEWDTAAGQALLEAAGGKVVNTDFEPLRYNQRQSLMSPSFYALGANSIDWSQILLVQNGSK